jgi:hypothetical protein
MTAQAGEPGEPGRRREPPEPPDLPRVFRLTQVQHWGLPILFAIPLLALLGVFGEQYSDASGAGSGLAAAIHYPSRIHYRQSLSFRVTVQNTAATAADSIVVFLDPSFMRAFTAVQLSAAVRAPYSIKLEHVAAGERRSVFGELAGERYWSSAGVVRVSGPQGQLSIPVSTFVFP